MRCWIDTDIGGDPDDAIALWCALRHPDVELAGISTVDGDVGWRAGIARDLLSAAGAAHVPVVAGPPPADLGGADVLLAIGPWTHVAALERVPERIVLMGGTLGKVVHRGNDVWLDWNVEQDLAAAQAVLARAELPLLVVPLDVTATLVCTNDERAAIARLPFVAPPLAEYDSELVLHDPFALLAAIGDAEMRVERRPLWVGGAAHDVVVETDAASARRRVVDLCK